MDRDVLDVIAWVAASVGLLMLLIIGVAIIASELLYPGTYDATCYSGGSVVWEGEVEVRGAFWYSIGDGDNTRIENPGMECILFQN